MHSVGSGLAPQQLGCGVPLGCEAAAHATRLYLRNMPPGHLLLKLDFKNAFNTLRRDKMLESVKEYAPELFTLVHSAYGQPSLLFCGDHIVESAEGVGAARGSTRTPIVLSCHPDSRFEASVGVQRVLPGRWHHWRLC